MNQHMDIDGLIGGLALVTDEELVGEAHSPSARALFETIVAEAPPSSPTVGLRPQRAFDRARPSTRPRLRRRLRLRLAISAAAAAVALGALGIVSGGAPSEAPASAKIVKRMMTALEPVAGTILHIDMTGTETSATGTTATWSDESWTLYPDTTPLAVDGFRQIVTQPGGPNGESAAANMDSGRPEAELYDPATKTIYTGSPVLPGGQVLPVSSPVPYRSGCMPRSSLGALMLGSGTSASGGAPAAAVAAAVTGLPYLGSGALADGLLPASATAPLPWSPNAAQQLKLALGCGATVVGDVTIDGHRTIEIAQSGHWAYYADAASYQPVRLELTGRDGSTMSLEFHAYEQLPANGNASLLSLTAQHPNAIIDNSTAGYQAAQARLFPATTR